jgi:hypothetical protein
MSISEACGSRAMRFRAPRGQPLLAALQGDTVDVHLVCLLQASGQLLHGGRGVVHLVHGVGHEPEVDGGTWRAAPLLLEQLFS